MIFLSNVINSRVAWVLVMDIHKKLTGTLNEALDNNLAARGNIVCYQIAGLESLTGFLSLAIRINPVRSW